MNISYTETRQLLSTDQLTLGQIFSTPTPCESFGDDNHHFLFNQMNDNGFAISEQFSDLFEISGTDKHQIPDIRNFSRHEIYPDQTSSEPHSPEPLTFAEPVDVPTTLTETADIAPTVQLPEPVTKESIPMSTQDSFSTIASENHSHTPE